MSTYMYVLWEDAVICFNNKPSFISYQSALFTTLCRLPLATSSQKPAPPFRSVNFPHFVV